MSDPRPCLPLELDALQRWLVAAISHPAGVGAGLTSERAKAEAAITPELLEQIVLPSTRLSAEERLAIYQQAYFARLIDALASIFPVLKQTLGDEAFAQFAVAYLQRYPSQSYTLHRLADRFVQFLEESQPAVAANEPSWPQFIIDLARLEVAIDRVFDAPGPEDDPQLTPEDLAAIDPERWPDARLRLAIGLELLAFDYPVGDFFSACKRGERPPLPQRQASYTALLRRNYIVRRYDLGREAFVLLSSLLAGASVEDAIAAAAEEAAAIEQLARELRGWFERWAAAGFFRGIEMP